jgi:hypothetical protein
VIRRGFWLTAGAVAGIIGYRRVSALGRRVSGRFTLGEAPRPRLAGPSAAVQTIRFARDVREGMDLYMARHSPPEGPTLGARDLPPARGRSHLTNHDTRPKDGH